MNEDLSSSPDFITISEGGGKAGKKLSFLSGKFSSLFVECAAIKYWSVCLEIVGGRRYLLSQNQYIGEGIILTAGKSATTL